MEQEEIAQLEAVLSGTDPHDIVASLRASATAPRGGDGESASITGHGAFADLPLSERTQSALAAAGFESLTAIQAATLPLALAGRDVLGAAKTGSGKSLAFLIPVVERLYRLRWTRQDGVGALVLSPTRELAKQIFVELRKVANQHTLTAALLTGGKDVLMERQAVASTNVVVATPGRLLQHMDESPEFDTGRVEVLVLDEADRCLDMGFAAALEAILENIPRGRQTLLFSATQTKSVKSLARLSLRSPEYVSVHEAAAAPTPVSLKQAYTTCNLEQKVEVLLSFVRSHRQVKTVVFMTSCKQVQFMTDLLKRLRPGVSVQCLHGRMKQPRRAATVEKFANEPAMLLLATDVAARGLDFPAVDWVLQMDCPEDVDQYIHRVGRTSRAGRDGSALLLLTPREGPPFLERLRARGVPIRGTKLNLAQAQPGAAAPLEGPDHKGRKAFNAAGKVASAVAQDAKLKEGAAKAFGSYLKSVTQLGDPAVFERDITKYPLEKFALSLGMPSVPRSRFLKAALREAGGGTGGVDGEGADGANGDGSDADSGDERELERGDGAGLFDRAGGSDGSDGSDAEGEGGDVFAMRRRDVQDEDIDKALASEGLVHVAGPKNDKKRKRQRITNDGKIKSFAGTKVVFNEEGDALDPLALLSQTGLEEAKEEARAKRTREETQGGLVNTALLLGEEKEAEERRQMLAARGAGGKKSTKITFDYSDASESEGEGDDRDGSDDDNVSDDSEGEEAQPMEYESEEEGDEFVKARARPAPAGVDSDKVSSHFAALRARIKEADAEDVATLKARLKEQRLKKKNKLKALAGDEPAQAMLADEDGGMVTLGGAEYSDESSESEGDDSDRERSGGEGGRSSDSSSEDDSEDEEDTRFGARQRRAAAAAASIQDQEALALKMLRR
eukprot:PRCOL_00005522-RA